MPYLRIGSAFIALTLLVACNTLEGVGRDVQGAGQAVEQTAKKVKRAIAD